MKTTKLFFMAALALTFGACSSDYNELAQQPAKAEGITITAQLAPKSSIANTRAVEEGKDGNNKDIIKATWDVDEHLAILYTKGGNQMADARITEVDGSGNATIEFTVVDETPDNTECVIIYPYSAAKDDKTGLKDAKTLLKNQDGTLSDDLDVRVGAGKIQVSTPSLDVTTQPAAQFAIWKLTTNGNAKNLCILADNEVIASATLATEGTVFTVAVPAVSSKTVTAVANNAANACYYNSKAGVSLAAGNYYQSTMAALDDDNSKPAYMITGNVAGLIVAGQTLVLSGANISGYNSVYFGDDGVATLILMGTNTIANTDPLSSSILVDGAGTLTITGTGSLTVQGIENTPGIVGANPNSNIIICGGTINATGGEYAPGIGSRKNGDCGTITITDGVTSVTSTKGAGAPDCIGRGDGISTCAAVIFGSAQVFNGINWSSSLMEAGNYGGLNLAISTTMNTNDTWTLTPAP